MGVELESQAGGVGIALTVPVKGATGAGVHVQKGFGVAHLANFTSFS